METLADGMGDMRMLVRLLIAVAGCYGLACLLLVALQAKLVWFPGPAPTTTPADHGLAFRDVELTAADGVKLHAWLVPAARPRGALLFCHGNAGSIEERLPAAAAFHSMDVTVLLFDYRGYGRSGGSPTEEGTYQDAQAAWDELVQREGFEPGRVLVFGESLGGAVAAELARRRPLAGLILESAFTSIGDVGAEHYKLFPVRWLAHIRYDTRAKLADVPLPLLLIHSPDDEIVPFAHAERLLAAARGEKELARCRGGHNDGGFLTDPGARAAVARFVERRLPARGS